MEAELRLAAGDPPAARQRLADWRGDEPFPAWTATVEASILLAEGRAAAAAAVVAPHLVTPGPESSLTWMVQAGVLTALAGRAVGDQGRVTRGLDLALDAAEREGFRRPFVAGGHPLRELINAVAPAMGVYRLVVADLGEVPDPSEYFAASALGLGRHAARRRASGGTVDPTGADGAALPAGHTVQCGDSLDAARLHQHRQDAHQEHLPQARRRPSTGGGPAGPRPASALTAVSPGLRAMQRSPGARAT